VIRVAVEEKLLAADQILELLANDESWHDITDIVERTQLSESETLRIIDFLSAQRLIVLDRRGERAKTDKKTARLLKQIFREARQGQISGLGVPL
jgi:DNA-binding IclR family transcriptional regulator